MTTPFDMDWEDAQIDKELENDAVNKSIFEKEVKKLVPKNKHKEIETLFNNFFNGGPTLMRNTSVPLHHSAKDDSLNKLSEAVENVKKVKEAVVKLTLEDIREKLKESFNECILNETCLPKMAGDINIDTLVTKINVLYADIEIHYSEIKNKQYN